MLSVIVTWWLTSRERLLHRRPDVEHERIYDSRLTIDD
jgi:hypothetical protein